MIAHHSLFFSTTQGPCKKRLNTDQRKKRKINFVAPHSRPLEENSRSIFLHVGLKLAACNGIETLSLSLYIYIYETCLTVDRDLMRLAPIVNGNYVKLQLLPLGTKSMCRCASRRETMIDIIFPAKAATTCSSPSTGRRFRDIVKVSVKHNFKCLP